jgi:hypothetical protein
MTASLVKELYNSPNGDRWLLNRDVSGKLFVSHHPNVASGGQVSTIEVNAFLSRGQNGPEHQALVEALARLDGLNGAEGDQIQEKLLKEVIEKLSRALGQAVARCWSSLPQDIQQNLFEAAVKAEGETIRQELAVYLHGKHDRTVDAVQARAMPEPDSLGG